MAKKKQSFELDDYGFNNDLDIPDFSFDAEEPKDDRKPATKIATAALGGVKDAIINPSTVRRLVKDSLPRGFGSAMSLADETAGTLKNLYNTTAIEIKPAVKDFKRVTKRLMPAAESVLPRAMAEKIKKWADSDADSKSHDLSLEQQRDASLQAQLGDIFKFQAEAELKRNSETDAGDRIKEGIEHSRHLDTLGQMDAMRVSLQQMANYQSKIDSGFQRKSLELQFRHYFVAVDSLEEQKRHNASITAQNAVILKNTGLPEYAKIKQSEALKEILRNKFLGGIGSTIFDKRRELLGTFGNKLVSHVKDKVSSMAGDFQSGLSGVDGILDIQQMQKDMAESGFGGPVQGSGEMGANMVGGMVGDGLMKKLGKKVRGVTKKYDKIEKAGNQLSGFTNNVSGHLKDWADDDSDSKIPFAQFFKELIKDSLRVDNSLTTDKLNGMANPDIFGRQTNKSITEIIPGFLSRIYRELKIIRTGDLKTELTEFDFAKDKFSDKTEITRNIFSSIVSKGNKDSTTNQINDLIAKIDPDKTKLTKEQHAALGQHMLNSNMLGNTGDASRMTDESTYTGNAQQHSELFANLFKDYFKDDALSSKNTEFKNQFADIGAYMGTSMSTIQEHLNSGRREDLEKLGLIDKGSSNINTKKLQDYFYSNLDTSENDSLLSPKVKPAVRRLNKKQGETTSSKSSRMRAVRPEQDNFFSNPNADTSSHIENTVNVNSDLINAIKENNSRSISEAMNETLLRIEKKLNTGIDFNVGTGEQSGKKAFGDTTLSDMGNGLLSAGKAGFGKLKDFSQSITKRATAIGKGAFELGGKLFSKVGTKITEAKDIFIKGLNSPAMTEAKMLAGHYKEIVDGKVIKVINSLSDLTGITGDIVDVSDNDKIVMTAAQVKDAFVRAKTSIGAKLLSAYGIVAGKVKDISNYAGGLITGVYASGLKFAKKAYDYLTATDIYVKGEEAVVLLAMIMRSGGYTSEIKGTPVTNPNQIDGPIKYQGNYALTSEQIAKGLEVIENGVRKPLVTGFKKLYSVARDIFNFGKDKLEKGAKWIGEKFSSLKDKTKSAYNKTLGKVMPGIQIGGGGQVSGMLGVLKRLTEIRNILDSRLGNGDGSGTHASGKRNLFGRAKNGIRNAFDNVSDSARNLYHNSIDRFGNLRESASGLFGRAKTGAKNIGHGALNLLGAAGNGALSLGGAVGSGLLGTGKYASRKLGQAYDFAAPKIMGGVNLLGRGIGQGAGYLKDKSLAGVDALREHVPHLLEKAKDGVFAAGRGIGHVGTGIGNGLKTSRDYLGPKLGSALTGTGKLIGRGVDGAMGLLNGDLWENAKKFGKGALTGATALGKGALNAAKGLKDKLFGESKQIKLLTEIRNLLDTRLAPKKKHIIGDTDGDGVRDGSLADILGKKKSKDANDPENKGNGADLKRKGLGGTIVGGAKSLYDKLTGKKEEEKEGSNGVVDMVEGQAITSASKGIWGKLKGVGLKGGLKIAGKGLGLAGAAYGAYSAYDSYKKGNYGDAALNGGMAAGGLALSGVGTGAIMGGLGTAAGALGTGLAGLAGLISLPVVVGALAVGAVGAGIYYLATRKSASTPLTKLRYAQYGFLPEDTDHVQMVFGLEDKLKEATVFDGSTPSIDGKKLDLEKLLNSFNVDPKDNAAITSWSDWFNGRFKPVYLTHIAALKSIDPKLDLGDVDSLSVENKRKYLNLSKFTDGPYNVMVSPFPSIKTLTAGVGEVIAATAVATAELTKEDKNKTGTSKPSAALATIATTTAVMPTLGKTEPVINAPPSSSTQSSPSGLKAALIGGTVISVMGVAGSTDRASNSKVDALAAIRYKTYGLKELDTEKVRALDNLESLIAGKLNFINQTTAGWEGSVDDVLSTVGSSFGISGINNNDAYDWKSWFNLRFLPTYLNFITAICTATNTTNPEAANNALKPQMAFNAGLSVITTKGNYSGSEVGVWQIPYSPWVGYTVNTEVKSTDENLATLKGRIKTSILSEEKDGATYDSGVTAKKAGGALAAGAIIKPATPTAPKTGFFSTIGNGLSNAASAVGNAISNAASAVGSGISNVYTGAKNAMSRIFSGDAKANKDALVKEMVKSGISNPNEQAMFLAQMDHESGGFKSLQESFNYKPAQFLKIFGKRAGISTIDQAQGIINQGPDAMGEIMYGGAWGAKNLGNTQPGDGAKFKGGGFTQLTGRDNYTRAGQALGIDLVNNPNLAAEPATAAKISTWFWKSKAGLSQAGQAGDVAAATRAINGGDIGLSERKTKFEQYLQEAKNGTLVPGVKTPGGVAEPTPPMSDPGGVTAKQPLLSTSLLAANAVPLIPVSNQSPTITTAVSPTSGSSNASTTPSLDMGAAAASAGFASPRSKDISVQNQYQKDVVGESMGKVSDTLDKSLDVQKSQLTVLQSILGLIGKNASTKEVEPDKEEAVPSSNTSGRGSVKQMQKMPTPPVSMAKPVW